MSELITSNEILADFIGWKKVTYTKTKQSRKKFEGWQKSDDTIIDELQFDKNWDHLLEVLKTFTIQPIAFTNNVCDLIEKISECVWINNIESCYDFTIELVKESKSIDEEVDEYNPEIINLLKQASEKGKLEEVEKIISEHLSK